ncbi:MAG: hypothetical protein IIB77_08195, partial [Proteobacteria bacterium]|nr:hypothetical protein [Pseudomonadota bacterium]
MRLTILLTISLFLSACGTPPATYADARAAAMTAIAAANDRGHAWTTSDQLIDEADKAVRDGNESLAISLADEARIQLSGNWGTLQLGDEDGAEDSMNYGGENLMGATGGFDGDIGDVLYFAGGGVTHAISAGGNDPGDLHL